MDELGLDDALDQGAVLVEWPVRAPEALPPDALHVRLSLDDGERSARITGPARWQGLDAQGAGAQGTGTQGMGDV